MIELFVHPPARDWHQLVTTPSKPAVALPSMPDSATYGLRPLPQLRYVRRTTRESTGGSQPSELLVDLPAPLVRVRRDCLVPWRPACPHAWLPHSLRCPALQPTSTRRIVVHRAKHSNCARARALPV